jgi:hypothetical protein
VVGKDGGGVKHFTVMHSDVNALNWLSGNYAKAGVGDVAGADCLGTLCVAFPW